MSGPASTHRLFFALRPEGETLDAVEALQARLAPGQGRAVPRARLHVTLLFLGNQAEPDLERMMTIAPTLEFEPCRMVLDRLGHFPRAAVAWLGPDTTPPVLLDFQRRLCAAVEGAGVAFDDRPWRPHLTLYRDLRKRPATIAFEPIGWRVEAFELMESRHRHRRLEYVCRGRWPAAGEG